MSIVDDIRIRVFYPSALPDRTGPHAVGTAKLKVHANGRGGRAIVVQLWYPVEEAQASLHARGLNWLTRLLHPTWAPAHHRAPLANSETAFPFIAYVPDAHGHHDDNTFTLANLASHGFILAAIDDPYRQGRIDFTAHAPRASNGVASAVAAHDASLVARGIKTVSALLDGLQMLEPDGPGGLWAGRINLKQVGILGYAMGGTVAADTALADPRFNAAANLAGGLGGKARLNVPYLLMLSDSSRAAPQATSLPAGNAPTRPGEYRYAQDQAALPESHVIEVAGTKSEHFSDKLIFPSWISRRHDHLPGCKRIRAIIDSYTVAFFTTYLRADPHPLMCVRHSPYPEVHFVTGSDEHGAWALQEPAGRA